MSDEEDEGVAFTIAQLTDDEIERREDEIEELIKGDRHECAEYSNGRCVHCGDYQEGVEPDFDEDGM